MNANAAKEAYKEDIRRLCHKFSLSASSGYPSLTFYKLDKQMSRRFLREENEVQGLSHWKSILDALEV